MKYIGSRQLQKAEGRKTGKYLITLEVSDYDVEMLEDLALVYVTTDDKTELKPIYSRWLKRVWHQFWKLWSIYDE